MSVKTSLANLPHRRSRHAEATTPIIPTELQLPDGRKIPVKDIAKKITNRVNYNLLKKRTVKIPDHKPGRKTAPLKYTLEERIWQSQATTEDIQARYAISFKQAQGIKYNSRYIVDKLSVDIESEE